MLSLSKRVDYALIALAHLAERPGGIAPAREIAQAYDLPLPLLMNILKELHQHGMVRSVRGTKGGYVLEVNPGRVTLYDLIVMLEGSVQTTECAADAHAAGEQCTCRVEPLCPVQAPLRALHERLVRFLRDVKLSDVIAPGRRIDVPVGMVGMG